jgi:nucleoside-diphosphate-sugar epimerase
MRTLIFGASGYIGSHVARRLVCAGHKVTAIVRSEKSAETASGTGATAHLADIDETPAMAELLLSHDAVVWVAQLMLEDERRFVEFALRALRGTGKTFIFTSGTSLLSERTNGEWIDVSYSEYESFVPRRQIAPRLAIENMVREYATRGVRALCIRPPLIWGNGGSQAIKDLYHSADATGAVCFIGRGLNVYSNVHVEDLAELFLLAVERGVPGALYHGVSGEVSFRSMAEAVAREVGVPTRSISIAESIDVWDKFTGPIVFSACSRTRSPRARAELGWRPTPERSDILEECRNPAYRDGAPRPVPAHVDQAAAPA